MVYIVAPRLIQYANRALAGCQMSSRCSKVVSRHWTCVHTICCWCTYSNGVCFHLVPILATAGGVTICGQLSSLTMDSVSRSSRGPARRKSGTELGPRDFRLAGARVDLDLGMKVAQLLLDKSKFHGVFAGYEYLI